MTDKSLFEKINKILEKNNSISYHYDIARGTSIGIILVKHKIRKALSESFNYNTLLQLKEILKKDHDIKIHVIQKFPSPQFGELYDTLIYHSSVEKQVKQIMPDDQYSFKIGRLLGYGCPRSELSSNWKFSYDIFVKDKTSDDLEIQVFSYVCMKDNKKYKEQTMSMAKKIRPIVKKINPNFYVTMQMEARFL